MTQSDPSIEAEIPLEAAPEPSETEPNLAPASEVLTAPPGDVSVEPAAPAPVEPGESSEALANSTAEPPTAPPAPPAPSSSDAADDTADQWSSLARSAVLGALIGMALIVWVKAVVGDSWLTPFLQKNDLPMPDRMGFLRLMLIGAAVAAIGAGGAAYRFLSTGRDARAVERVLWFASPLILLPAGPMLFRASAWKDRHEDLLPIVVLGGMLCEVLFFQSLRRVPERLTAFFDELRRETPAFVAKNWALIAVLVSCTAYAAFMSFYTIRWHHKLGTAVFDLAITNNLIYGGLEGVFNHSPIIFPENPGKYVANHVQTGLYAFLPFYALHPQSETLQIIQSTSLGFGALPLFLFARKRIPEWAALVVALCYLSYYPLHGANFYEVKTVPIAAAFLLTTIWAADAKKWVVCWLAFTLTLLLREDMPVGLAVVGGFFLLSGYRPRTGFIMAVIGTAWFIFIRFYVMDKAGQWWFPSMYKDLWAPGEQGFKSVIKTLLTNPVFTLKHIIVEKKVYYLLHLLVPLMFLPARRWYLWAAFIPGAILTLLVTDYAPPTMFSFQYVMHWAPYLFVAAVLCIQSISERADFGKARAGAAVLGMAFASAVLSFNYGAFAARDKGLQSGYAKITFSFSDKERQRYEDLKEIIRDIPPKATVAATEHVGPHVSSRVGFYSLRRGSHGAEYLLAREQELGLDRTRQSLFLALKDNQYGVIKRVGEMALMKKGADPSKNQELITDWNLAAANKRKKPKSEATSPGPNGESGGEPPEGNPEEPERPTENTEGGAR
jgi:uncharacterized membrane protein